MKAHKTTLSVRELQKTIGQWKSRKITDSTVAKLLELLLGMPAYMNEDAVYPSPAKRGFRHHTRR